MVKLISYPFRLDNRGSVQTTEDGEDYYGEELACLIQTRPGERYLVPQYGISDPAFEGLDKAELIEKIGMFGPPVTITVVESERLNTEEVVASISYEPVDPETVDGGPEEDNFIFEELNGFENDYDTNPASVYLDATEGG